MDLYEALKSGTSADELLKAFHADLDKANERIAQEQKEEELKRVHADHLTDCRNILAEAIVNYIETYLEDDLSKDLDLTVDDVAKILEDFEKEMESWKALCKNLSPKLSKSINDVKTLRPSKSQTFTADVDKQVFDDFLKSFGLK